MVYKVITDYVRPEIVRNTPCGMSISRLDNGCFLVSSRYYSSRHFRPYEVISFMSQFIYLYCGRVLTATFITDGIAL